MVEHQTRLIRRLRPNNTIKKVIPLLLLSSFLLLQSCNRKFLGFSFSNKDELKIDQFDFEYFSSKTKFKYKNGNSKVRATANIRIKKDSIIWMSITPGIGIEAARAKITRDSLILIDRVNKQVLRFSYPTLSMAFNFDFDFPMIQAIVLGNLPIPRSNRDLVEKQANHFLMTQNRGDLEIENTVGLKTRKLEELKAISNATSNTMELKYSDFKLVDEYAFPYKALLVLNYFKDAETKSTTIDIEHNRPQIEKKPLKFPFNIPKRYERK